MGVRRCCDTHGTPEPCYWETGSNNDCDGSNTGTCTPNTSSAWCSSELTSKSSMPSFVYNGNTGSKALGTYTAIFDHVTPSTCPVSNCAVFHSSSTSASSYGLSIDTNGNNLALDTSVTPHAGNQFYLKCTV